MFFYDAIQGVTVIFFR